MMRNARLAFPPPSRLLMAPQGRVQGRVQGRSRERGRSVGPSLAQTAMPLCASFKISVERATAPCASPRLASLGGRRGAHSRLKRPAETNHAHLAHPGAGPSHRGLSLEVPSASSSEEEERRAGPRSSIAPRVRPSRPSSRASHISSRDQNGAPSISLQDAPTTQREMRSIS